MDISLWRVAQPRLGKARGLAQPQGLSREQRTTRRHTLVMLAAALPLLLLLLSLPLVALVLAAPPRVFAQYLGQSGTVTAIALSLSTSMAAMLLVIAMGAPLAYLIARDRLPLPRVLEVVLDLPMVLPPAVAALALLMAFGRRGTLGSELDARGVQLAFTTAAVVMAQMFVSAPYYIETSALGFASSPASPCTKWII